MKREYPRGQEEFARVLAFSDGVYAIAMTLLVLSITLPNLMVENSERSCSSVSGTSLPRSSAS